MWLAKSNNSSELGLPTRVQCLAQSSRSERLYQFLAAKEYQNLFADARGLGEYRGSDLAAYQSRDCSTA